MLLLVGRIAKTEVIVDPRKQVLISRFKSGMKLLRIRDPEKAYVEFSAALELALSLEDSVEEKKAVGGLASLVTHPPFNPMSKILMLIGFRGRYLRHTTSIYRFTSDSKISRRGTKCFG